MVGNVSTVITRRGLPGSGLLAAPLRAAAASTRMAVTASAVVAGTAAGTALLGRQRRGRRGPVAGARHAGRCGADPRGGGRGAGGDGRPTGPARQRQRAEVLD